MAHGRPGAPDWILWTAEQAEHLHQVHELYPPENAFEIVSDALNLMDPNDGPTAYEVVEPDALRMAHNFNLRATTARVHHWEEAVEAAERWNDPAMPLSPRAKAALRRLQALGSLDRWYGWCSDVFMKIFLDIDDLFFNSTMRENVYIGWCCEPNSGTLAYSVGPGWQQCPRTSVWFNLPHLVVRSVTIHDAIMVVIHELCHAFLQVHCNSGQRLDIATIDRRDFDRGIIDDHAEGHGIAFTRVLKAVQARLGPTRFLYMVHEMGQRGGTVAEGTPLKGHWMRQGHFMTRRTYQKRQRELAGLPREPRGNRSEPRGVPEQSESMPVSRAGSSRSWPPREAPRTERRGSRPDFEPDHGDVLGPYNDGSPYGDEPYDVGPYDDEPYDDEPWNDGPYDEGPYDGGPYDDWPYGEEPYHNGPWGFPYGTYGPYGAYGRYPPGYDPLWDHGGMGWHPGWGHR